MYRINYLARPVLITTDEVLFHIASDGSIDPRQLLQNVIVAEERLIAPAICDEFYYDFLNQKNKKVTAMNQAQMVADINASLIAQNKATIATQDIPIGTWINAIEFVTNPAYVELWDMFLWKLTAEAVDWMTTVPSWLRHTTQGQQKNNPEVIGGNGQGSASGDRKNVQFKMDKQLMDRIDPLVERMQLWICKRKTKYPLYCKECECDNPNGVSFKRKSDWVFGAYESVHKKNCGCGFNGNSDDECENGILTESGNCFCDEAGNNTIVVE